MNRPPPAAGRPGSLSFLPTALLLLLAHAADATDREPLAPLEPAPPQAPELLELGRQLFHDVRLSGNDTVSCAHCHPLARAGVDGLRVSLGVAGRQGVVNAPTVYNVAFHVSYFWDGVGSSRVDLQACKLEYSIVSPK
jgi:Cytochrome c peroxidase